MSMTLLSTMPQGIRNNNPGNIRSSESITWDGENAPDDEGFCTFKHPGFGVRAMYKILQAYVHEDGMANLAAMITRWAPPEGNDTDAYIHAVCTQSGIDALSLPQGVTDWVKVIDAMIFHENGQTFVTRPFILRVCVETNNEEATKP